MREYANAVKTITCLATVAALIGGCAVEIVDARRPLRARRRRRQRPAQTKIDPAQAERLKRIMVPLIAAMNKPRDLKQVKVGIMDDPSINAANAGNGEFFVTTGLLQKANDAQLTAITRARGRSRRPRARRQGEGARRGAEHRHGHSRPDHSGKRRASHRSPATLVARAYSRKEEYAADKHGAELSSAPDSRSSS